MSKYTNEQIATDIELWNEYFNTLAVMSDEEFYSLDVATKIKMLVEAFGEDEDATDGNC